MKRIVTACLLLVSASAASAAWSQELPPLRWKLEKGRGFDVEMEQNIVVQMELGGRVFETSNLNRSFSRWQVLDVDSQGVADVETRLTRISMRVENVNGKEMIIDTDSKGESDGKVGDVLRLIRPLIDAPMVQKMDTRGKILEIQMAPQLVESLTRTGGEAMAEMVKNLGKSATLEFPPQSPSHGQQWTQTRESDSPSGKVKIDTTYTYRGKTVQNELSLDQFDLELTMEFVEGTHPTGATIRINNQESKGAIFFNADAGRIESSQVEQRMETTVTQPGGQVMDQNWSQTIRTRFEDAD